MSLSFKFKAVCERCHKETSSLKMSFFNEDMCCGECLTKEQAHPKYEEAKRIENEECKKGNLNFPGIGLPDDLK